MLSLSAPLPFEFLHCVCLASTRGHLAPGEGFVPAGLGEHMGQARSGLSLVTGHRNQTKCSEGLWLLRASAALPRGSVCVLGICTNPPLPFQVRQQLSEMKSHVEDGDVAGSPEAPPAEQDPVEVRAVSWSSDVCH